MFVVTSYIAINFKAHVASYSCSYSTISTHSLLHFREYSYNAYRNFEIVYSLHSNLYISELQA